MPVKVRCQCGAGISAPDAARGKVIKCRKCSQPVRVPKGKGSGDSRDPRRKKAAGKRPSIDDDDFFGALDLEGGEDLDVRICPKCAAEVDEEDIECPECGVNLETGTLSTKQKKKRKRKGPDPDEYPKVVWSNSMDFLKKNTSLGVRLSLTFSVSLTMFLSTLYMAAVYCIPEDPTNPDTPIKVPVIMFWGFLSMLSGAASMGCFWQLFTLITKATMDEKDSLDRFNFDFFVGVALGVKLLFWPAALFWPIHVATVSVFALLTPGVADAVTGEGGSLEALSLLVASVVFLVVSGVMYLLPTWTLPAALAHMSAKQTYKAYIPYYMFMYGFRSLKGVCVWWLVAFCAALPALAILVPAGIFAESIYNGLGDLIVKLVELCGIETEPLQRGFLFALLGGVIGFTTIALSVFLLSLLIAFPAVYLMRATGLFSYYNQRELGLGEKRKDNVPAEFWVRYLAYTIDYFIIGVFTGIKSLMILGMIATVKYLEMDGMIVTLQSVDGLLNLLIVVMYYVFSEGTAMRGTLGKTALGLVVTDLEGNSPITKGQAFGRLIGRNIGGMVFCIGLLTCAWDSEKQTWHDKWTKTRVKWAKVVT